MNQIRRMGKFWLHEWEHRNRESRIQPDYELSFLVQKSPWRSSKNRTHLFGLNLTR